LIAQVIDPCETCAGVECGMLSDRQAVELFDLHFIRLLCWGPDKDGFAIKGDCNVRFFFESVRYSEDIELDVARLPVHALKEKVGKILEGPALLLITIQIRDKRQKTRRHVRQRCMRSLRDADRA
jgi:hypothetical protein